MAAYLPSLPACNITSDSFKFNLYIILVFYTRKLIVLSDNSKGKKYEKYMCILWVQFR
jgi:hypothetical protein